MLSYAPFSVPGSPFLFPPSPGYGGHAEALRAKAGRFGSAFRFGVLVLLALAATACATKRTTGIAVPRPFPGATLPPSTVPPTAVAVAPGEPGARTPEAGARSPEPLLSTALALKGAPYRNGGSDPSGFDCSGFVQWVFAQHGMRLPREVREQWRNGRDVDRDEIKAGDLVFFETVSRGASHVGIALGGDQFVHAPSSKGVVRVERFSSSYWSSRWVGARRLPPTSSH
jgi:cell wall-associated NlpC family hydrolase